MVNVTLLQWKGSFIVSFNLYVGFFLVCIHLEKKKSMQICSVWLRGNSCKATGITISLGIFFFPLPCTCRVDLNRVISSGVSFSKVNLTNSVVRESSQFVPVITLVRATAGLQSAGPGVEFRWKPRCSLTPEIPQGTQHDDQLLCKMCLLEVTSSTCHPLRDVLTSLVASSAGYLCLGTSLPPSLQSVKSSCPFFLDWRMHWDPLRLHPVDHHHYGVDEMSEHQGYLKLLHHVANGPKYQQTWSRVPNCTTFELQRRLIVGVLLLATQHNISLCPCFEKHQIPGMKGNLPIFMENFEGMGWAILNNSETSQTSLFLWILFHQSHWNFVCLCGNSVSRYHKGFAWHSDRSSILKYARWAYQ